MKVTVNTKELKQNLELHKKVIQKVKTPILNGIKLKAVNDKLELYSTDLEFNLKSTLKASADQDGEALVPFKNLENVVKSHDQEEISLGLVDNKVKIGALSLNCLNLEEFPVCPEVAGKSTIVDSGKFFDALAELSDCLSKDENRVMMTGYCLNTTDNEIVATDSYKLGLVKFDFSANIGKVIIPGKVYDLLKKVKAEELIMAVKENQIVFTLDNIQLVSRLLIGKFPEYKQILDSLSCESVIEFEPGEMIKHLVKAKKTLLNGYGEIPVKLIFNDACINIACEVKEIGSYSADIKAVGIVKAEITMAFNPSFMIDILKQFEGKVKLGIIDERRPVVFEQDEELKYILMPVRT